MHTNPIICREAAMKSFQVLPLFPFYFHLVGGWPTPMKNHGVRQLGFSGIPNMMGKSFKIPWFQTTNQYIYIYYPIYYPNGNTQQWLGYPISFHPPRTLPRATPRPSAAWETFLPAGGVPEWDSSNGTITMTTWQYGYESKPNGTLRHSWCSWMVMNNSPTKLW